MLKVNGAWYLDALPTMLVIEQSDKSLVMAYITPFRELASFDFVPYAGYHPRKCNGQPVPQYLYRFYGMERDTENATQVIHTRLTPTEKEQLQTAADGAGKPISEFIRDWVRSL